MTRILASLLVLMLPLSMGFAQNLVPQPNSNSASLKVEGQGGPPFPIINIPIFAGTTAKMEIDGGANSRFLVAQAPSLTPNNFAWLGGVVDLDIITSPAEVIVLMDGFNVAPWQYSTNGLGHYEQLFPIPPTIAPNLQVAFQGVVEDPTNSFGVKLTSATSIITHAGITPISYILADDNCIFQATASQFGFNIPFYATTYTGCFVCSNGYINFGVSSPDFTPSLAKMHSQAPKISMFWCDLFPPHANAGPITLKVDLSDPFNPVMTFKYVNIPDWPTGVNGGLGYHTFGTRIDISSGDVEIHEFASNQPSNYDILAGLSSGNSLGPAGTGPMDLSAQFAQGAYTGLPNEGFYEGFAGNTSITGTFPPSAYWDLTGNFWRHSAISAGLSGAYYIMDFFIPANPNNP